MKKNLVFAAVMAFTLGTFITGCGATESVSVEDRTQLVVGFDAEYPPYGFIDTDGSYTGFDLEMAQLVCESLGWEYIAKPIDWNSKDLELNSGTIDCIWNGFSMTPARMDQYAWSNPYADNAQVIVVASDSGITSLDDLAGINVLTQTASAADEALGTDELSDWVKSFASLTKVADYNSAFMRLESSKEPIAVAVDVGVAYYQVGLRTAGAFTILEESFSSEPYAIGFRSEDTELRDIINAEYLKLVESGIYEDLATKYGIDSAMLTLL